MWEESLLNILSSVCNETFRSRICLGNLNLRLYALFFFPLCCRPLWLGGHSPLSVWVFCLCKGCRDSLDVFLSFSINIKAVLVSFVPVTCFLGYSYHICKANQCILKCKHLRLVRAATRQKKKQKPGIQTGFCI